MPYSTFCKSIGFPLKNVRWSWDAISKSGDRALFTIGRDKIRSGEYSIWDPNANYNYKPGAKERKKIATEVIEKNLQAYGIVQEAKDPGVNTRTRKRYDSDTLLKLKLEFRGNQIVARFVGGIKVSDLDKDTDPLSSLTALSSAIEDIGPAPLGTNSPDRASSTRWTYSRNPKVREYVLKRAKGRCEYCATEGFTLPNGNRYLETHHIIALADEGADTTENVIALCPNHHREAHYGVAAERLEKEMMELLQKMKTSG